MKKIFVLVITFLVIGLAAVSAQTPGPGESLITVSRKSSSVGAQTEVLIWVDGRPMAFLKTNGASQQFTLVNGKKLIKASIGVVSSEITLDVNSKEYVLETVISGSGNPDSKGTKGTVAITIKKVKEVVLPSANNQPPSNAADAGAWNNIAALDTARNVTYLSAVEKDIILEMNKVRSDPKKYAELYIKQLVATSAAAKELYNELLKTSGCAVLQPKKGLSQAAKDHVADTGPKGTVSHTGTDGSSMDQRINRYGTWGGGAGENISYGFNAARDIIIQLLIDDGVEGRGHRKNIMNKNSKYVGVAVGTHSVYRYMCVQDFANDYKDK